LVCKIAVLFNYFRYITSSAGDHRSPHIDK
jgi:hypothetical protein